MPSDFSPFFTKYEQLLKDVDKVFSTVKDQHPDCVTCTTGCSDCCHAVFDLPLIEALYLNHHFHGVLPKETKDQILTKADQADRTAYKLKFQAHKRQRSGEDTDAILEDMARERVRCPLLNSQDRCDLYAFRPITCRLYGIPQEVGGKARTCALSKFSPGAPYPTVHVDKIHRALAALSMELVASLNTKYNQMADMLVPPSMALLTVYDDEYLGLQKSSGCSSSGCSSSGCSPSGSSTGGCGPAKKDGCSCGPNECDPGSCEPCRK
ncbi:YkgJ family cysteine cluster protein [Desulfonatronum lacustre]|uniref:YkgJ family cysteine cluster protein n=1 Tax=Desulfonatronum lacustre TaxID=66849 RepID=UPI0004B44007|nr:YkgJ family cysteine cluster protein [Desulfonatronum lacustre]